MISTECLASNLLPYAYLTQQTPALQFHLLTQSSASLPVWFHMLPYGPYLI